MNSDPAMPEARPTLSVVVPTYREAANVPVLFERLKAALADLPWEMIVVDDDSPDGTADVAYALAARDPRGMAFLDDSARFVGRDGVVVVPQDRLD